MKYSRETLKQMLIANRIETSSTDKERLLILAYKNGLVKDEDLFDPPIENVEKSEKKKRGRPRKYPVAAQLYPKEVDPKYDRLLTIRNNPTKIILTDIKTGDVVSFESYYKAKMVTGLSSAYFNKNNGELLDGYRIEVIKPENKPENKPDTAVLDVPENKPDSET